MYRSTMILLAVASFLLCHVVARDPGLDDGPSPDGLGDRSDIDQGNPHIVTIQTGNNDVCGGSILTENMILSAAHCIAKYPMNRLRVRAGSADLAVVGVKIHENFDSIFGTLENDIALLRVSPSLQLGSGAASVHIVGKPKAAPAHDVKVASDANSVQQVLKGEIVGRLNPMPPQDQSAQCARDRIFYSGSWASSKGRVCASAPPDTGICLRDLSGDPLLIGSRQIGIRSRGLGCDEPRESTAYVDVALYIGWIYENAVKLGLPDVPKVEEKTTGATPVPSNDPSDATLKNIYEFLKYMDPHGNPSSHRG